MEELLADSTIEAIGLFTGPVGRAELISRIIRAGKHVMTTKPFELDPARDRRAGRSEAASGDRTPELARSAGAGRPAAGSALAGEVQSRPPRRLPPKVWASYREEADGGWYDDPNRCPVAPIFRLGIYLINDMVRLFGSAQSVQVMHSRLFTGRRTPDNAQLAVRFNNGVLGNIFASFCVDDGQFYGNSMVLNHENGTIFRNAGPLPYGVAAHASHMSVVAKSGTDDSTIEHAEPAEQYGGYQWDAFHRAVRGRPLAGEESHPRRLSRASRSSAPWPAPKIRRCPDGSENRMNVLRTVFVTTPGTSFALLKFGRDPERLGGRFWKARVPVYDAIEIQMHSSRAPERMEWMTTGSSGNWRTPLFPAAALPTRAGWRPDGNRAWSAIPTRCAGSSKRRSIRPHAERRLLPSRPAPIPAHSIPSTALWR